MSGRIHYLERIVEDGPYIRARVIVERDGLSYAEIFEIKEPVYLKTTLRNHVDLGDPNIEENEIWWIQGFGEAWGESRVFVSMDRHGSPAEYGIPVKELVKVPAMLRIALECSD